MSSRWISFYYFLVLFLVCVSCQESEITVDRSTAGNGPGEIGESLVRAEPRIISFTMTPDSGFVGDTFSLAWETSGCTSVDLYSKGGTGLPANGSKELDVYHSDWYTLTAHGQGAAVTSTIWITIFWPGGSSWTSEYGNGQNTCHSPYAGPITGRLAWSSSFDQAVTAQPVIAADGAVLVATNRTFRCISPFGREIWRYQTSSYYYKYAVGPDGSIYLTDYHLTSLSNSGLFRWSIDLTTYSAYASYLHVLPGDRLAYYRTVSAGCGGYYTYLTILDTAGGIIKSTQVGSVNFAPAFDGDNSEIYNYATTIKSINHNGASEWTNDDYYFWGGIMVLSPGITYTHMYSGSYPKYEDGIAAIDNTGNTLFVQRGYRLTYPYSPSNMAAGVNNEVYFVAKDYFNLRTYLFAMNSWGGIIWQWEIPPGETLRSIVTDSENHVYLATAWYTSGANTQYYGHVRAFDPAGQLIWQHDLEPAAGLPDLCLSMDKTLYVTAGYQLYAFRDPIDESVYDQNR